VFDENEWRKNKQTYKVFDESLDHRLWKVGNNAFFKIKVHSKEENVMLLKKRWNKCLSKALSHLKA
jgi:hypothetical protein